MIELAAVLLFSYLLGAIPSGLLVGLSRGVDVRRYGSGKTGATNTLRTLGLRASAVVFAADFAKGVVPVLVARLVLHSQVAEVGAALAAVAGHNWSVYIRFQGGRGVTTSLAGYTAMSPLAGVVCMALGLSIVAATRYVSLASVVGAFFAPVILLPLVVASREPAVYLLYLVVGATMVILQHRDNIARLRLGTERRLGERARE